MENVMLKEIKREKNIEFANAISYDKMVEVVGNNIRVENAIIANTVLGYDDDRRIFSAELCFRNCAFGRKYSLKDEYFIVDNSGQRKYLFDIGSVIGMTFIMRIIDEVGVNTWEEVKNRYVRCVFDNDNNRLIGIGHIIDDKFLIPDLFFKTQF